MHQQPLISVLMPVFKADKEQLKIAVDSILNQTYRHFELIILFEGIEADPCYPVLKGIKDKRVKCVIIPLKSGLPKSLNMGIDRSKGKYIARMDADDYSIPDRFERQIGFLETHPDIDVVGGICRYMNSNTVSFSTMISPERRTARMLFSNAGVAHPTAVIRREFIEKNNIRYNEKIKGSEDYHLWVDSILVGGRIESINSVVLLYRISDGQAHNILKDKMIEWDNMARQKILDKIGSFSEDEKQLIYSFCAPSNKTIDVKSTLTVFKKLIQLGRRNPLYTEGVFEKEVCYEWIQKGILSLKDGNGVDILAPRNIKELWVKNEYLYIITEYVKKIVGKVFPPHRYKARGPKC